jgi:hypothetical protein
VESDTSNICKWVGVDHCLNDEFENQNELTGY